MSATNITNTLADSSLESDTSDYNYMISSNDKQAHLFTFNNSRATNDTGFVSTYAPSSMSVMSMASPSKIHSLMTSARSSGNGGKFVGSVSKNLRFDAAKPTVINDSMNLASYDSRLVGLQHSSFIIKTIAVCIADLFHHCRHDMHYTVQ